MFTKQYYKKNRAYSRYESKDVIVALYEGKYSNASGGKCKYFAAHVVLKNYNKMHIAKANGKRSNGFQTVYQMVHDKKVKNGCIRYVIPTQTGKSEVMSDISEDIIVKAIEG